MTLALVTEPHSGEYDHLVTELAKHEIKTTTDRDVNPEILVPFVNTRVSAEWIDRMTNLRLIAAPCTGLDHIDLDAARARAIAVVNVPDYGSVSVAEHVFALLLTLSRFKLAQGFDLSGKTIGVVGTGAIGRHVIGIAHGFGMNVLAYDLDQRPGITYATDLADLLGRADIVTLHVPATAATHHLISRTELARMMPGAILVNTARGELVDTAALADALASGHLAGAGLDVIEPVGDGDATPPLLNAIVTPHVAYNTREAVRRITDITIANIVAHTERW